MRRDVQNDVGCDSSLVRCGWNIHRLHHCAANGTKRSTKVLSHGVVQGAPVSIGYPDKISITARQGDPDRFWDDCSVAALSRDGGLIGVLRCERFIDGVFCLNGPLPSGTQIAELRPGIEAPVLATRLLLGIPIADPLPPLAIRLGTTRGTNALLTRKGVPVGLVITRGLLIYFA